MAGGICIAYDGPLGAGMGDVCLYDTCRVHACTRKAIAERRRPPEPENAAARAYRDDLANRRGEQDQDY